MPSGVRILTVLPVEHVGDGARPLLERVGAEVDEFALASRGGGATCQGGAHRHRRRHVEVAAHAQ